MVGRISFFVNAGMRFVTEMCKMRAFAELWDEITRERYGVTDPKQRLFRYGVQVNSLGLTEQQPENNVYRILIEMLAVTLSKNARARAVQLPAWNEALGLPRPWDQQWSLRMQQILAYETDLLEYGDIFDGSTVIAAKVEELKREARDELARIDAHGRRDRGGRDRLHEGAAGRDRTRARIEAIERGEQIVVGVNRFTETEPSPLAGRRRRDPHRAATRSRPSRSRGSTPGAPRATTTAVDAALARAARAPRSEGRNVMPASIACAKAGVTTGEWGAALREVFGEYRAPTGVGRARAQRRPAASTTCAPTSSACRSKLGRRLKFLVGKPGLDGHSNGAEQIAVRARDAGMEVVYEGIRLTPAEIVNAALRGRRARRRPVDPLRLARAAGASDVMRAHARGRARRRPGRRRRHHPARGRRRAAGGRASPRSTRPRISS